MSKVKKKFVPVDMLGWPVERIKGHPVTSIIRVLLHMDIGKTRDYMCHPVKYEKRWGWLPDGIDHGCQSSG